jgi:hypothetical protein
MIAWRLFYHPMTLPVGLVLWLVIPLSIGVVVIYKTVRTDTLRRLPIQIAVLVAYVLAGLAALGAGLYLIQEYWP